MGEVQHLEWRVGDVIIRRVEARVTAVPHGSLCSGLTPEVVDEHRPWVDPFVADDGRMLLSIHSFAIHDGSTTMVVDTCVGAHGDRPLPQDPHHLAQLRDAIDGGLDAVNVVVCTHLHFDHVGWNTIRDASTGDLVPTFPNATYLVSRDELENFADHDHSGIAGVSVDPLVAAG
ncbi:MAG: MBL fold metallo-hydrolase, partial [Ilumatobacteraceae bacterium]